MTDFTTKELSDAMKKVVKENPEMAEGFLKVTAEIDIETHKFVKKAIKKNQSIHAIKQFLMLPCFGICVLGIIFLVFWLFPQVGDIAFFNTTFGTLVFMIIVIAIASIPITFIHKLLFPDHYSPK